MYDPLRAKARTVAWTVTAFVAGLGMASGLGWTEHSLAMPAFDDQSQVDPAVVAPAKDLSDAFTNLSDVVTPAVVRIEATRENPRRNVGPTAQVPEGLEGFDQFFRQQPQPRQLTSGGSGFVISEDGYVLTNDHVVNGAEQIRVYFPDRRVYPAEVVGTDPFTDVAVIRVLVDDVDFPTLSFGDSDEVEVGEWILAIGNPGFGAGDQLDYTVTAGIVSARGRGLNLIQRELLRDQATQENASYAIEDFIQTDAVINPGNSGGPMVGMDGRVIGINSAIASETGYYQGYGFAIPINLARRVMEDLIEYGYVRRPVLGVRIDEVDAEFAELYGLPSVSGVLVQEVTDGSPAAAAGLEQEDVIVAIDGEPVGYVGGLQAKVAMMRPGDEVTVTVFRDGAPRDFTFRLDEAELRATPPAPEETAVDAVEQIGIQVTELTEALAREAGFDRAGGAVVTQVSPGSIAQRRGFIPGDRILEIGDTMIEDVEDVDGALSAAVPGEVIRVLVDRVDGGSRVLTLRVPG